AAGRRLAGRASAEELAWWSCPDPFRYAGEIAPASRSAGGAGVTRLGDPQVSLGAGSEGRTVRSGACRGEAAWRLPPGQGLAKLRPPGLSATGSSRGPGCSCG